MAHINKLFISSHTRTQRSCKWLFWQTTAVTLELFNLPTSCVGRRLQLLFCVCFGWSTLKWEKVQLLSAWPSSVSHKVLEKIKNTAYFSYDFLLLTARCFSLSDFLVLQNKSQHSVERQSVLFFEICLESLKPWILFLESGVCFFFFFCFTRTRLGVPSDMLDWIWVASTCCLLFRSPSGYLHGYSRNLSPFLPLRQKRTSRCGCLAETHSWREIFPVGFWEISNTACQEGLKFTGREVWFKKKKEKKPTTSLEEEEEGDVHFFPSSQLIHRSFHTFPQTP